MSGGPLFRDIMAINYFPGKKVIGVGARISDPLTALSQTLQALRGKGLTLLSLETIPNLAEPGEYLLFMFLDVSGAGERTVEELVSRLESSGAARSARIISSPIEGLVSDSYFDFKGFLGNRAIIFGAPALNGFLKGLYSTFGQVGAVFLYHTGKSIGRTGARYYRDVLNIRDLNKQYRAAEIFFHALGYVKSVSLNRSDKTVTAILVENLECTLVKDIRFPPTCNWVRGMIEGVVEVFEDASYESQEVECINNGNENCKIVLRPITARPL